MSKWLCLWPGLPELWVRGQWRGLWPAVVFAVWLNAVLIARFCYREWIDPWALRAVGMSLTAWWMWAGYQALRAWPTWSAPPGAAAIDRLSAAQAAYLRGQWLDCEQALRQCLAADPRDAPARLLLVSVYRQTSRFQAAEQQLDRLSRLETGDLWWLERQREAARVQAAKAAAKQTKTQ